MATLSPRQERMLAFIHEYHDDHSYMPSVREIPSSTTTCGCWNATGTCTARPTSHVGSSSWEPKRRQEETSSRYP